MSTFFIKILAMTTMLSDHISRAVYGNDQTTFLNYVGRFAFILFCFQIVLGYKRTRSLKKYLFRLFIIGIISQIPYALFFNMGGCNKILNVNFTLFLGLLSISIINFHKDRNNKFSFRDNNYNVLDFSSFNSIISFIIKSLLIVIICLVIYNLKNIITYSIEYNYQAILFIISIYFFYPFDQNYDVSKILLYVLSIIIFAFYEAQMWFGLNNFILPVLSNKTLIIYFNIFLFCLLAGILLLFHNGKKGKSIKWLTYLFYPVHLFILYILFK